MDLWDVAKLLWRRRWVSLPLVLLTVAMASYVAIAMDPDYKSTGHVTLLPPTETKPERPTGPSTVSPWNVWSLSDALVIYTGRADIKKEFAEAGLSEEWTTSVTGSNLPIIEIEVVASGPTVANATLSRLVDVLTNQLAELQAPYGTRVQESITAKVLDVGQNGELVTSSVKRAVIVVLAVGFVVTAAASIWVDAIVRRRRARRAEQEEPDEPTPAPPPPAPVGRSAPGDAVSADRPVPAVPTAGLWAPGQPYPRRESLEPTIIMRRPPASGGPERRPPASGGPERRPDASTGRPQDVAKPAVSSPYRNPNPGTMRDGYRPRADES
ncbi:hypothetical protein [Micromonospora costi]|uniref:Polysaccharide chain length determinant N-terminal domain-containing protein n=1 Tax=Micromonospora costi TaxID=1530042 RepID=A0A3B0ABN9_9ACTN|nr:hypothetical protein [Micromonospora costi]RKN57146.1 hypothetical protein D7193_00090 [Micromonospora costi]